MFLKLSVRSTNTEKSRHLKWRPATTTLNFVESHISWQTFFHGCSNSRPIYHWLLNLEKMSQTETELLRFENFQYGGFDLDLWPWLLKSKSFLLLWFWTSLPHFMKIQLVLFEKSWSQTNELTNVQTRMKTISPCPFAGVKLANHIKVHKQRVSKEVTQQETETPH